MRFTTSLLVFAAVIVSPTQANYLKQWYNNDCSGTVNDYQTTEGCFNQQGASVSMSFPGCKFFWYKGKCGSGTLGGPSQDATAFCWEWNGNTGDSFQISC